MLSLKETVEAYSLTGLKKTTSSSMRLIPLATLAGFQVAAAGHVSTIASFGISNVSVAKLISGALFPIGLITIILTGTELFTGNCLITISVLDKKTSFGKMLRNWFYVYFGDFLGSLILAAIVVYCGQLSLGGGALAQAYLKTASAKCSLGFADAFFKGVICNIMVCVGVFCAVSSKDTAGKVLAAFFPVMAFVIMGAEHCIANMFYIPTGLLAAGQSGMAEAAAQAGIDLTALTWSNFFVRNLIPVTLGNIAGGCGFAALMFYTHAGKTEKSKK